MNDTIDMQGQKAKCLAALYNASKPLGMGMLHFDGTDMTESEAAVLLFSRKDEGQYFDYLKGRVMKLSFAGESINPWGYDRDNGQGAAARAIAEALGGE